jgi:hypothetical protein
LPNLTHGIPLADAKDSTARRNFVPIFSISAGDGIGMPRCWVMNATTWPLDVPALRTLFGVRQRPAGTDEPSMKLAAVIERPRYDLTLFKVHFGLLTLKGYTKGERVLRFEAIVHNTRTLKTGRGLEKFPEITARLAGMAGRFCTMLDCADTGFIPDGLLDELPLPARIGAIRTGGIDLNRPRMRAALAAAAALAPAPGGFTVADFAARVRAMTGQETYTVRQAAYDLRKLRGKDLAVKPGKSRRYQIPPDAARAITALLTLRDHVLAPILAGVRSPRRAASPASGLPSTATTRTSASACRPCSSTSASKRSLTPHRQQICRSERCKLLGE